MVKQYVSIFQMINRSSKMIESEMKDNQEITVDTLGTLDNDKDNERMIPYP